MNAGSWLGSDLDLRLGFSTDLLFDSEQDNLWISYLSILSSTFLNGGGENPITTKKEIEKIHNLLL